MSWKHGWLTRDNKQQVQQRHKWLLTRSGKLATCLSGTGMMDSGFAGCFQLSSGSLLWNLPDLRPSGFPSVHRWQETRTRHKRKCHDNGRTRKRPFSRRLVWLPWLEYFPTERMEERTSLEAERSLPLSQTVPLSSPSDVPWTFQSRVVGFGIHQNLQFGQSQSDVSPGSSFTVSKSFHNKMHTFLKHNQCRLHKRALAWVRQSIISMQLKRPRIEKNDSARSQVVLLSPAIITHDFQNL